MKTTRYESNGISTRDRNLYTSKEPSRGAGCFIGLVAMALVVLVAMNINAIMALL